MNSKLRPAFADATTPPRPSASKEVAKPYCIRLKPSEKARLEELAGDQTVSAFVRERCLGNEVATRRRVKRYQPDHEVAAKLLAYRHQYHGPSVRLNRRLGQICGFRSDQRI